MVIEMSQPLGTGTSQPLGTTTGRMVAIRLKTPNKYIFRALLSLASANLLIRVMGLLNQVVVSARFGQGTAMEAYFVAATLPITTTTVILLGGNTQGIVMLCIGTLLGQILQLGVIIIRARQAKFTYHAVLDLRNPDILLIGIVAWPSLFGALISQASPLIDQM